MVFLTPSEDSYVNFVAINQKVRTFVRGALGRKHADCLFESDFDKEPVFTMEPLGIFRRRQTLNFR